MLVLRHYTDISIVAVSVVPDISFYLRVDAFTYLSLSTGCRQLYGIYTLNTYTLILLEKSEILQELAIFAVSVC